MKRSFVVDSRELKEIHHCLHYSKKLAHGTVGHNLLMLNAKAFDALGFGLAYTDQLMFRNQLVDMDGSVEVTVEHNESS